MSPLNFLLVVVPIWLMTNFWLLPILNERWKSGNLLHKITRSGTLAAIEKIRDLSIICIITILILMLFLYINSIFFKGELILANNIINILEKMYEVFKSIKNNYFSFLTWSGIIGCGLCLYLIGKSAKNKVRDTLQKKALEVRERYINDLSNLEELEENPNNVPLIKRVKEISTILAIAQVHDEEFDASQITAMKLEADHLINILAMEQAKREINIEQALIQQKEKDKSKHVKRSTIFSILRSEQFAKDIGLISKPLSYVITGLFLISLIGWSASPVANSLQLSINNLTINAIEKDVSRNLTDAVSFVEQRESKPLEEENLQDTSEINIDYQKISQVSRAIARISVHHFIRSQTIENNIGISRTTHAKTEFVKAAILEKNYDPSLVNTEVSRIKAEVAKDILKGSSEKDHNKLLNKIELEIKPTVEKIYSQNPSTLNRILKKIEGRYSVSITPFDAQSRLLSNIVNQAFSVVNINEENEVLKQGKKILKGVGKKTINTLLNTYAKAIISDMLLEQSNNYSVLQLNKQVKLQLSEKTKHLLKNLNSVQPNDWKFSSSEQREQKISSNLSNNIANRYDNNAMRSMVKQNLAGYSEVFSNAAINSAEALTHITNPKGNGTSYHSTHNASKVKSQWSNFKRASISSRVRGVLFGQDLLGERIQINDIKWHEIPKTESLPTLINLFVYYKDEWQDLGSFPAALISQGIRYAADQRVVATTISQGDDEIISRVTYLHPSLIDTPLGCRIVEADRFIDTFSFMDSEDEFDNRLKDISNDRMALHEFIRFSQLAERVALHKLKSNHCPHKELEKIIQKKKLGNIKFPQSLQVNISSFLDKELNKPERSDKFLKATFECAKVNLNKTADCLCKSFPHNLSSKYWLPLDHTSQIRERETDLSEDLTWLKTSDNYFEHIDLWLHTTFSLQEITDWGDLESSQEAAMDFDDDKHRLLKDVIVYDLLEDYLINQLNSPSFEEFMAPIEQFIVIQRLMRAAFNDQLAETFPLEKLITLNNETKAYVPSQPTIRWEPFTNGEERLLNVLTDADQRALTLYLNARKDRVKRYTEKKPLCGTVSL